jgi:hypothetical protein
VSPPIVSDRRFETYPTLKHSLVNLLTCNLVGPLIDLFSMFEAQRFESDRAAGLRDRHGKTGGSCPTNAYNGNLRRKKRCA